MRTSEAIAIVYFVYLSATALFVRLPLSRRLRVWAASVVVIAAEFAFARSGIGPRLVIVRDWLPALVILTAYFTTGLFYVSPSPRAEAWLKQWDARLLDGWAPQRLPRIVRNYFDLVYDACFLVVPAGFAVLVWAGKSAHADRYWTLVSAAEFVAFATLPWFQARPPWAIEQSPSTESTPVRSFSLSWVNRTTIHANTFPSGHASASLAVALALWPEVPWAGALFTVIALSIAAGSIVGRFHYAIDAVAGVLLALGLAALAAAAGV